MSDEKAKRLRHISLKQSAPLRTLEPMKSAVGSLAAILFFGCFVFYANYSLYPLIQPNYPDLFVEISLTKHLKLIDLLLYTFALLPAAGAYALGATIESLIMGAFKKA